MDEKEKEKKTLLKAKEELDAQVSEMAKNPYNAAQDVNILANEPYDAELPMGDIVSEIAVTESIARGGDYKYWVVDPTVKTVRTVVDGTVVQVRTTTTTSNTLTFSEYDSNEDYIYIGDMSESKYDAIARKVEGQHEGLNRLENKLALDISIAGAEAKGNTFANISGRTVIDYEVLTNIVASMGKHGTKIVMVSGSEVTIDLKMMDYRENKNRVVDPYTAGVDKWIKAENYQYEHSGTKTVLATDKAVFVATSDSKKNRSIHVVRRKMDGIVGAGDKERLTVIAGPGHFVGAVRKLAFSTLTYENLGIVSTNDNVFAVYKKAASY